MSLEKGFETLLKAAKDGDGKAIEEILMIVNPIVDKNSRINGEVDEDLQQSILIKVLDLIHRFKP